MTPDELEAQRAKALIAGSRIAWPVNVTVEPGPFGARNHIATRSHVELIGGSPALHVGGRPVAWYENWIRA